VVVGLVGRGDVVDFVAALLLVVGHAAHPELGDLAYHGPAGVLEPVVATGGEVVLPLGDGNIGVDMDLAEHAVGEVGGVVDACLGVGLPRVHGAPDRVLP